MSCAMPNADSFPIYVVYFAVKIPSTLHSKPFSRVYLFLISNRFPQVYSLFLFICYKINPSPFSVDEVPKRFVILHPTGQSPEIKIKKIVEPRLFNLQTVVCTVKQNHTWKNMLIFHRAFWVACLNNILYISLIKQGAFFFSALSEVSSFQQYATTRSLQGGTGEAYSTSIAIDMWYMNNTWCEIRRLFIEIPTGAVFFFSLLLFSKILSTSLTVSGRR